MRIALRERSSNGASHAAMAKRLGLSATAHGPDLHNCFSNWLQAHRLLQRRRANVCAPRDIAMTHTYRSITRAAAIAVLVCLTAAAPHAAAQAHVQEGGDYAVRASTVSAASMPDGMRERHGIGTDPNTAVLNVTVQRKAGPALGNVPARVEVRARNLAGVETSVDMREVVANDLVSYMGTYRFLPREVLDFKITALPQGRQQPITLEFRDRLGRR